MAFASVSVLSWRGLSGWRPFRLSVWSLSNYLTDLLLINKDGCRELPGVINEKYMAHEIEADFVEDYYNEDQQCRQCTSFANGYCHEAKTDVPPTAHCDFFQAKD